MPKRAAEPVSPGMGEAKASPKKAKTPPKKAKEAQTMTYGAPCYIQVTRGPENIKLWNVVQEGDKSDGFVRNLIDDIRNKQDAVLKTEFDFRGDVTRRVSLASDEPLKNFRKSLERKCLVQLSDQDNKEFDMKTAKQIQTVSKHTHDCSCAGVIDHFQRIGLFSCVNVDVKCRQSA